MEEPSRSCHGEGHAWRTLFRVGPPGPSGVWRAARVHGLGWNRRDPSAWPASGKDRWYKPMVKSSGGQRESEGVVVSLIGVQHNAPGGKGPHFDHGGNEVARQGMTGTARSNHPGRPEPVVLLDSEPAIGPASLGNVRRLQRRLWTAAKQSEERRFHAMYDRDGAASHRLHRGLCLCRGVRESRPQHNGQLLLRGHAGLPPPGAAAAAGVSERVTGAAGRGGRSGGGRVVPCPAGALGAGCARSTRCCLPELRRAAGSG
jgi:hypothetical protein